MILPSGRLPRLRSEQRRASTPPSCRPISPGCTRRSCPPRSPSGPRPRSSWRWPCAATRTPCTGCSSPPLAALLVWTLGVICRYSVTDPGGARGFAAPDLPRHLHRAPPLAAARRPLRAGARALREPALDDRGAASFPPLLRYLGAAHQLRTSPGDARGELRSARGRRHRLERGRSSRRYLAVVVRHARRRLGALPEHGAAASRASGERRRAVLLAMAAALPVFASFAYIFRWLPLNYDLTAAGAHDLAAAAPTSSSAIACARRCRSRAAT